MAALMIPKMGSTICVHRLERARPALVATRWAMGPAHGASGGGSGGSAFFPKSRARHPEVAVLCLAAFSRPLAQCRGRRVCARIRQLRARRGLARALRFQRVLWPVGLCVPGGAALPRGIEESVVERRAVGVLGFVQQLLNFPVHLPPPPSPAPGWLPPERSGLSRPSSQGAALGWLVARPLPLHTPEPCPKCMTGSNSNADAGP